MTSRKTSIYLDQADMETLRHLATEAGLTSTRGPGAGRDGSVTALLRALVAAYAADPARVRDLVQSRPAMPPPVVTAPALATPSLHQTTAPTVRQRRRRRR